MKRVATMLPWVVIWTIFFIVGMFVRRGVPIDFDYELYGYDYGKYSCYFSNYDYITYTPLRHPLLGLFLSPFVSFLAQIAKISQTGFFILLQGMFAAFGTISAWIVKKISGWVAVSIFLLIPFVWLAAIVPESYAISMCILLATVWWAKNHSKFNFDKSIKSAVWLILFVFAGGVTLTNGLKVMIAYIISNRITKRELKSLIVVAFFFFALGVVFFAIRMWVWNMNHPETPKSIAYSIKTTLVWMQNSCSFAGWIRAVMINFFIFPFSLGNITLSIIAVFIYIAAALGILDGRRECVVQVMAGMFVVDVFIHIICGWALEEAWIFSPHWIWIIPIAIGELVKRHRINVLKIGGL